MPDWFHWIGEALEPDGQTWKLEGEFRARRMRLIGFSESFFKEALMSSSKAAITSTPEARWLTRVLEEGYGPGAWHGPDLKAALADVSSKVAFWRPSPERHNIAEVALHHAYCVRGVRGQLSGTAPEPFVLEGEDWFELSGPERLAWPQIQEAVEKEQSKLVAVVADTAAGHSDSKLSEAERSNLVLGITCHAVYHAGQIQLLKRLHGA
jgi:hypothetical protein